MRKFLALLLLISGLSQAETLGQNPYFQQMQKNNDQAQAEAAKAFDQKYPAPKLPSLAASTPLQTAPPTINTVPKPPPIQPQTTTPLPSTNTPVQAPPDLTVLNQQKTEQKDNANPAFNIFVPPTTAQK